MDLSSQQKSVADRILWGMIGHLSTMYAAPYILGASALRAASLTSGDSLNSIPLPKNQWQIECRHWFRLALARLQAATVSFVSNLDPLPFGLNITAPNSITDPELERQCHAQKIRSTGAYQSFSVLAIALILALGGAVIVISVCVGTITALVQRRVPRWQHKHRQWEEDYLLELLAAARRNRSAVSRPAGERADTRGYARR